MSIDTSQMNLADLMPHAAPMILLTSLLEVGEEHAICEVTINEQSMFFDKKSNSVPAWVGIEYMAQSISVHAGVHAQLNDQPVKIGLLLGSRRYESEVIGFEQGDCLQIRVQKLYQEANGLAGFECKILKDEQLICEAKLNVFSPQDTTQFFMD
jgi:predicted hotdog family 3-hydroxylacyl-ACP dehydratase